MSTTPSKAAGLQDAECSDSRTNASGNGALASAERHRAAASMEKFLGVTVDSQATASEEAPPSVPGYDVLERVGGGGQGEVYRARQHRPERIVAMKMLPAGPVGRERLARFRAEADAVARLQHPNVVQIHAVGEQDGRPYLVLEFCAGGALADHLAGAPQPPRDAAALVETLARAIHTAHEAGVVHRDLKPQNVLLAADGTPKIADFGLAKRFDDSGPTQTLAVLGTPAYMAPEQAAGETKSVGPAADVYALGAILYELLTGRPPFQAATSLEMLERVKGEDPISPRRLRRGTPRDIETICLKCLQKEPARRYRSAAELAEDLRRFQVGEPIRARRAPAGQRILRWVRRRRAVAVPSLICLITVFVAAAVVFRSEPPAAAPAGRADRPAEAAGRRRDYVAGILRADQLWKDRPKECEEALAALRDDPDLSGLRDFEWYYLWARCHFRLIHRVDVGAAVTAAELAPDGRLLATGTADGTVALWDVGTWSKTAVLSACAGPMNALAFSPDGGLLACGGSTAGRGQASLFSLAAGEKIRDLQGRPGRITGLAFSPDAATLATCGSAGPGAEDKSEFRLWDVKTGGLESRVEHPQAGQEFLSCASLGEHAAMGEHVALGDSDGYVWKYLWRGSPNSLAPLVRGCFANGGDNVQCLRANGNWPGNFLAHGTSYGRVCLGYEGIGGGLTILQSQGAPVRSVEFGPNWLAAGDEAGRIRVWGCETRKLKACVQAPDGEVRALKLLPDGRTLVSGGGDGVLNVWDVGDATDECRRTAHGEPNANLLKEAWAVAFSPDGRTLASAGDDSFVKRWDVVGGAENPHRLAHWACASCVAYSPDGTTIASGGYDNVVILWESATGKAIHRLQGHKDAVRCLAFSPDGRTLATGSRDKLVKLWDVKTGERRWAFPGEAGEVRALAFSPDGRRLVQAGAGGKIRFWDLPDEGGEPSAGLVLSDLADEVRCAAFSPDGRTLATGDKEGWVRLWDVAMGESRGKWKAHDLGVNEQAGVNALAFTPDGRTLATGGDDKRVRLWQAASGELLLMLSEEAGKINGLTFDRDGQTLAVASHDGTVRLWRGRHPGR
jgi:eukaryotic-like serine/threonine-protein kinase